MARITPKQVSQLPKQPGVYQMKDAQDELLYVGKAKNLKNRVSGYFQSRKDLSPRIQSMVEQIVAIDYVVTNTENEALLLENNMIKGLKPKYNILMRDDKKYPWLILTKEPFPRLVFTREPYKNKKGQLDYSRCFGPYVSAGALYQTLLVIKKVFPLRQRKKPLFKDRPCMNYHIGACLGPCQNLVTKDEYQKLVDQVVLFLKGNGDHLLEILETQMAQASEALEFERASVLRDRYFAVETILQRQKVIYENPEINQDVIGCATTGSMFCGAVFKVRKGKLQQTLFFEIPTDTQTTAEEVYESFVFQYYQDRANPEDIPQELVLQFELEDEEFLLNYLGNLQPKKKLPSITYPKRGQKIDVLSMAIKNATESAETAQLKLASRIKNDPSTALLQLQESLNLPQLPRRMECYDISHIQGTNTVASMVVFTDGLPDKKEYRKFKITVTNDQVGSPDDFASMNEVITRRFTNQEEKGWPDPDLIIIDGGKGQLGAALDALKAVGITEQPIISLAKKFEEVFLPNNPRPIVLPRDSTALFMLQSIRDEAHRFAITYHRQLRAKTQTQSVLDDIPLLGPRRKQRLIKTFKTAEKASQANIDELAQALEINTTTAEKIRTALIEKLN